jgi:HEPN domain-containing protein
MKEGNNNRWVTESPLELFIAAQRDIVSIGSNIDSKLFSIEDKKETICRSAAESSEKMLKAWIRNYDDQLKISKTHDLIKIYDKLITIDANFKNIEEQCASLNNYTTEFRYGSPFAIEKHEMKKCLKDLKCIYDFLPIKITRNKINDGIQFIVLPEDINTLFGEYAASNSKKAKALPKNRKTNI